MKPLDDKTHESMLDRVKRAALSGGVSGALINMGHTAMTGTLNPKSLALSAIKGAGLFGGVSGIGAGLGEHILGKAGAEEENPGVKRGAVGGGLAGAAVGGLAGLALATGKFSTLGKLAPGMKKAYENFMAKENIGSGLINKVREAAMRGSPAKAAAYGAGAGGIMGGYYGADEGLQTDAVNAQLQRQRDVHGG